MADFPGTCKGMISRYIETTQHELDQLKVAASPKTLRIWLQAETRIVMG
jgi:hypothetical protein